MRLASVEGAVRKLVDHATSKRCPACGGRPLVYGDRLDLDRAIKLQVRCHGSTERFTVGEAELLDDYVPIKRLAAWLDDLFKVDAFPDMMELLAYNRGRLPTPGSEPR